MVCWQLPHEGNSTVSCAIGGIDLFTINGNTTVSGGTSENQSHLASTSNARYEPAKVLENVSCLY
jgi:hypothetical protein